MKCATFILVAVLALAVPQPASANPLKNAAKKTGHALVAPLKKLAHGAGEVVLIAGMIVGAIAFCSSGGCN